MIYVICSTCGESQAYQHLSGCCERHLYLSYKLNYIFSDISLCCLFRHQYLRSWTMELIITLGNEAGWKRNFLLLKSNIQHHLLSMKMCAHLWYWIGVVIVGLQQHTGSGVASTTLPITDDPSCSDLFSPRSHNKNMALPSAALGMIN